MGDAKKNLFSSHNRTDIHMNSQRLWQYAQNLYKSKTNRIPTLKIGSGDQLWSLTKKLSLIDNHVKKNSFFYWSFTGYINCTLGCSMSSYGKPIQIELNGISINFFGGLILLTLVIFVLFVYFVCYVYFLLLRILFLRVSEKECVLCMRVCMCVWEKERQRQRQRECFLYFLFKNPDFFVCFL